MFSVQDKVASSDTHLAYYMVGQSREDFDWGSHIGGPFDPSERETISQKNCERSGSLMVLDGQTLVQTQLQERTTCPTEKLWR